MAENLIQHIGVDMDEVLYPFSDVIFKYYHEKVGSTRHFDGAGVGYRFHHAWGITEDRVIERVEEFFATDAHHLAEPLDGSVEAVRELAARGITMTIITARQHMSLERTSEWIEKHFSGLFKDIITCNHYSTDGSEPIPKADALHSVNGDLLVDDSVGHVHSAIEAGKDGVVFGDYSWNFHSNGFHRVNNWNELKKYILSE